MTISGDIDGCGTGMMLTPQSGMNTGQLLQVLPEGSEFKYVDRFAFYERAKQAYAVLVTGISTLCQHNPEERSSSNRAPGVISIDFFESYVKVSK